MEYKLICGKIISREWGTEYRFTADVEGKIYNEIIMLNDIKTDEKTITNLVTAHLERLVAISKDIPVETTVESAPLNDITVEKYLKDTGVIPLDKFLIDIKTALTTVVVKEVK